MASSSKAGVHQAVQHGVWARHATSLLGLWLTVSAFALPQAYPLGPIGWVIGLGLFLSGVWALRDGFARWIGGALAVWLAGVTCFTRDVPPITYWNDLGVAIVALVLAFIGAGAIDAGGNDG